LRLDHKGQQRQVTRTLDRHRQLALMLGTVAGLPSRTDLAAVGQVAPQRIGPFIVNVRYLFLAEEASLAATREPTPSSTPALSSSS
jgi:hypothetical protein